MEERGHPPSTDVSETMPGTSEVSVLQEGGTRFREKSEGHQEIEEVGAASMDASASRDGVSILHEQEEECDEDERLAAILQLQHVSNKGFVQPFC